MKPNITFLLIFFAMSSPTFSLTPLVTNDSEKSFLEWIKEPNHKEALEYLRQRFDPNNYNAYSRTNKDFTVPTSKFSTLSRLEVAGDNIIPDSEEGVTIGPSSIRVWIKSKDSNSSNQTKFIDVYSLSGLGDFTVTSQESTQVKNKLEELKNKVKANIVKIDDLFYTDDLKAKTLKIVDKKYKLLELQVDEAYLRGLQLNDPDNQDLTHQLEENDVQKALIIKELESIPEDQKIWKLRENNFKILKAQADANKKNIDIDVDRIWAEGEAAREAAAKQFEQDQQNAAAERVKAFKQKQIEDLSQNANVETPTGDLITDTKLKEVLDNLPPPENNEFINIVGDGTTATVSKDVRTSRDRDIDAPTITTTTYTVSALPTQVQFFNGGSNQGTYQQGGTTFNLQSNSLAFDFGDGLKVEKVDKDGKSIALVTLDKNAIPGPVIIAKPNSEIFSELSPPTTAGVAKDYVDNGDTATLEKAKTYADTGDTATLEKAKTYADTGDKSTLTKANKHADEGDKATLEKSKKYSDLANTATLAKANDYTDKRIATIGNLGNTLKINETIQYNANQIRQNAQAIQQNSQRIANLDKKFTNAIAVSGALSGLPQATQAGESMFTAAISTYDGHQALAIGYSQVSDNNKHLVKFGLSSNVQGSKKAMGVVGYGFKF